MMAEAIKKLDAMTSEEFTKMLLECGYPAEELLYASIEKNAELEVERDYYLQLSIKCRREKRYPSQNEISTLLGGCPVSRKPNHCCGAQGFEFGDVCLGCELDRNEAHADCAGRVCKVEEVKHGNE